MLRLTLEVVPYGEEEKKETLATVAIINDGTGNHYRGNYNITFAPNKGEEATVRVSNHDRAKSPWVLLEEALRQLPDSFMDAPCLTRDLHEVVLEYLRTQLGEERLLRF